MYHTICSLFQASISRIVSRVVMGAASATFTSNRTHKAVRDGVSRRHTV